MWLDGKRQEWTDLAADGYYRLTWGQAKPEARE
jgi:hypothetical protein